MQAFQGIGQFSADLLIIQLFCTPFSNDVIIRSSKQCLVDPEKLPDQSPDPISTDGVSYLATHRDANSGRIRSSKGQQDKMGSMYLLPGIRHMQELVPFQQSFAFTETAVTVTWKQLIPLNFYAL